jgi:hypothetical protein
VPPKIYSTGYAFAALKADGSITAWGDPDSGGTIPTSIGRITPAKVVSYTMNGDISAPIVLYPPTKAADLWPVVR